MQIVEHGDKTATIYLKEYLDFREMLTDYLHKKNLGNFSVTGVGFLTDSYCEELIRTISVKVKQTDA